jgi:hypothetical protein
MTRRVTALLELDRVLMNKTPMDYNRSISALPKGRRRSAAFFTPAKGPTAEEGTLGSYWFGLAALHFLAEENCSARPSSIRNTVSTP